MNSTPGLLADVVPSSFVDGPGNRYVVFLQGCSFDCLACHNPHTIGRHTTARSHRVEAADVADEIACVAPFLTGVTVSGGESTLQWEFVRDLFVELRERPATARLTRLVDTNGDTGPDVWAELLPVMDGAMVDLKAIDPEVHRVLTGHGNDLVLESIRLLDRTGGLAEVRLLVIPGVNDAAVHVDATARFLTGLTTAPTVNVLGFRHAGTREVARRFREATADDLLAVAARLRATGVDAIAPGAENVPIGRRTGTRLPSSACPSR